MWSSNLSKLNQRVDQNISCKKLTVPTPLKGAASIQKIFFEPMHYVAFEQNLSALDKIHLNAPI